MTKDGYKDAWRCYRLNMLGTLNFEFPRYISLHVMEMGKIRNATMFRAVDFKKYGLYHQGLKRL